MELEYTAGPGATDFMLLDPADSQACQYIDPLFCSPAELELEATSSSLIQSESRECFE